MLQRPPGRREQPVAEEVLPPNGSGSSDEEDEEVLQPNGSGVGDQEDEELLPPNGSGSGDEEDEEVMQPNGSGVRDQEDEEPLPPANGSGSGDGVCGGPPKDAIPLDWGMALRRAGPDPNNWPAVVMEYGAGTDTNILPLTNMLNKTLSWSVDLSQAGCQNVVAFQMVDAKLNEGCYCDGNGLSARPDDPHSPGNCKGWMNIPLYGGVQPCQEIDFMEANIYEWKTTLHDGLLGKHGWDYGSGGSPQTEQGNVIYMPRSPAMDPSKPFHVKAAFLVYDNGTFSGLKMTLSQGCLTGPLTTFTLFPPEDQKNLTQLGKAIQRGMTPGFSYWNTGGPQSWFDDDKCFGTNHGGPVVFYDWGLTDGAH